MKTENENNRLPCMGDTNGRLAKMLGQEEAYKTKKYCCLCPIIEYFGISVPFYYYSLLGQVIDFPSRVRVVKKILSTGRVASTRHSLVMFKGQRWSTSVKCFNQPAKSIFISLTMDVGIQCMKHNITL